MAYLFTQIGNDIDGEAAGDSSGRSVSVSADGSVVAIEQLAMMAMEIGAVMYGSIKSSMELDSNR